MNKKESIFQSRNTNSSKLQTALTSLFKKQKKLIWNFVHPLLSIYPIRVRILDPHCVKVTLSYYLVLEILNEKNISYYTAYKSFGHHSPLWVSSVIWMALKKGRKVWRSPEFIFNGTSFNGTSLTPK